MDLLYVSDIIYIHLMSLNLICKGTSQWFELNSFHVLIEHLITYAGHLSSPSSIALASPVCSSVEQPESSLEKEKVRVDTDLIMKHTKLHKNKGKSNGG